MRNKMCKKMCNAQSPGATRAGAQCQCAIHVQCWVLIKSVGRLIACGCENLISLRLPGFAEGLSFPQRTQFDDRSIPAGGKKNRWVDTMLERTRYIAHGYVVESTIPGL